MPFFFYKEERERERVKSNDWVKYLFLNKLKKQAFFVLFYFLFLLKMDTKLLAKLDLQADNTLSVIFERNRLKGLK